MVSISVSNFVIAIPEIYLAIIAFIMLLFGLFTSQHDTPSKIVLFNKLSILNIFTTLFCLILVVAIGDTYVETFNHLYIISPLIYIFKIIIISFVLLISILSRKYLIENGTFQFEYIVLIPFFLLGNLLMISSNDFIAFYITFELVTVCSYIFMFINKNNTKSNQAGIKYFLLGTLGTAFLLYGISMIYGYTGVTNFIEIRNYIEGKTNNWILLIGMILVIVGISFKLSLVPFHMWTPDVYRGINKFMLLMMAVVTKFSILFIFLRILWEPLSELMPHWHKIIMILVLASAVVGFIVSIYQTNIKSFIAYSSIANMSYLLIIFLNKSITSVENLIIYVITYGVALVGFVGTIMLINKDSKPIEDIYDLKGLYKNHPYLSFILSVFLLSMAGLPITAGFFAKLFILYSVFIAKYYILGSTIAILSVIMMYFYLKLIRIMYFDHYEDIKVSYYSQKGNFIARLVIFILFLFTLGFIFFLYPLTSLLNEFTVLF